MSCIASPSRRRHAALASVVRYNVFAVAGKVLTGVFLQTPALKRSVPLYLPFQLAFLLSHFMLLQFDLDALLSGASLLDSLSVTGSTIRLGVYSAMVGTAYGFVASLIQCLVKEYFGLLELAKIQPIAYGCVIVGCMGGMFLPGFIHDLTGSYLPFLMFSFATTSLNFACWVFLYFAHPIGEAPPRPYQKLEA